MIIVGVTGPIGHGKTTFANALSQHEPALCHLEASMAIMDVANALHKALPTEGVDPSSAAAINKWLGALPDILHKTLGVTCSFDHIAISTHAMQAHPVEYEKLTTHLKALRANHQLARQKITPKNKSDYRAFLQWLGGYLVAKVDPAIWFNEITRRITDNQRAGCKVCVVGGVRYPSDAAILRTAGARIIKLYRPNLLQTDTQDPTERQRDDIQPDSTVVSDGSVKDLQECAVHILKDLRSDKLQPTYHTKKA